MDDATRTYVIGTPRNVRLSVERVPPWRLGERLRAESTYHSLDEHALPRAKVAAWEDRIVA